MALRFVLGSVTIALTACQATPTPRAEMLTLDAIFASDRFEENTPQEIRWLPDGESLIFRQGEQGTVYLWRHEVSTGVRERLFNWDDIVTRLRAERPDFEEPGTGDVNRTGRYPDEVVLSPDGTHLLGCEGRDLYLLELASGEVRYLTEDPSIERHPTFSPDGKQLAFVQDGDLYTLDLVAGAIRRLTDRAGSEHLQNGIADWVYEEEFGVRRSYWWSPQSDAILFVQYDTSPIGVFPVVDHLETEAVLERQRYPKAGQANSRVHLGIRRLADSAITWIDRGDAEDFYLPRAGWRPDGQEVWYQWLNRDQSRLELRFASAESGEYRLCLEEEDNTWINIRDDMSFVDEDRFLWSSERDGWRHIYLYDTSGDLLQRLTSGEWQVEAIYGLDADKSRVFFQATEKDPRERHVYSVTVAGGHIRRLTDEEGTHSAELGPGGKYLLETFSNVTIPPRLDLSDLEGRKLDTVNPGKIPAMSQVSLSPVEFGTLDTEDGETLYTAMIKPPDFRPDRKHPVVLYVYGGPHAQLVRKSWFGHRHLFFQALAQRGFVVFWLDNRGTWGRGKAFESMVHRRLGEWELKDQLAGVNFLRSLPFIDSERIGVYGGSYGGYMALTCALKAPQYFRAAVAYAPVTDWKLYDTIYTERYMDTPDDNAEGYRKSAPLTYASSLEGKLLLVHGTMDNNVHMQNSIQLINALVKSNKQFEFLLYPRVRHGIRTSRVRHHFHQAKLDFLLRSLQ